jgi:hypothetical protein
MPLTKDDFFMAVVLQSAIYNTIACLTSEILLPSSTSDQKQKISQATTATTTAITNITNIHLRDITNSNFKIIMSRPNDIFNAYWPSNDLVDFWTHWYSRVADNAERAGMSTQDYHDQLMWDREMWHRRDVMEQAAADERERLAELHAAELQAQQAAAAERAAQLQARQAQQAAADERERAARAAHVEQQRAVWRSWRAALERERMAQAAADERAASCRRLLERINEGINRELSRRQQRSVGVIGQGPGDMRSYRKEVDDDGKVSYHRLW